MRLLYHIELQIASILFIFFDGFTIITANGAINAFNIAPLMTAFATSSQTKTDISIHAVSAIFMCHRFSPF
jgi:hypothetical protein